MSDCRPETSAEVRANMRDRVGELEAENAKLRKALYGAYQQLDDHLSDDDEREIDELYAIRDAMLRALANEKPGAK